MKTNCAISYRDVNVQNFNEVRCTVVDFCDQTKSRMYLKTLQKTINGLLSRSVCTVCLF